MSPILDKQIQRRIPHFTIAHHMSHSCQIRNPSSTLLEIHITYTMISQKPPTVSENFEAFAVGSEWNETTLIQLIEHVFENFDEKKTTHRYLH